jgi:2-polyprenyl-6-methoxyphenol hydroxylase-like FAD-dependent oxidoreductase
MHSVVLQTKCCVVGGGPAGMMLGYLLARKGVQVTVLEKHSDFFRDFRGDTVHPSTLEVLNELGLMGEFLELPHQRVESLGIMIGGTTFDVADFRHVPASSKFVALMPQWDFLNFLSSRANRFSSFQLLMQHEATDLVRDAERVTGVVVNAESGQLHVRADLVVACDGRQSLMRTSAGLQVVEHGVPIDVLWFRISRNRDDLAQVLGNVNYGKALILINRSDYFQAGLIIAKGTFEEIKARGLEAFRNGLLQIAPYLGDCVNELHDWAEIKILTVQINRLQRWHRPGLLCIGDAAHAMSPAGGVGINLAIQDAVAAANRLTEPLLGGRVSEAERVIMPPVSAPEPSAQPASARLRVRHTVRRGRLRRGESRKNGDATQPSVSLTIPALAQEQLQKQRQKQEIRVKCVFRVPKGGKGKRGSGAQPREAQLLLFLQLLLHFAAAFLFCADRDKSTPVSLPRCWSGLPLHAGLRWRAC